MQNDDLTDDTKELLHECKPVEKKHVPKLSSSYQCLPRQEIAQTSHQEGSTADLVREQAESSGYRNHRRNQDLSLIQSVCDISYKGS